MSQIEKDNETTEQSPLSGSKETGLKNIQLQASQKTTEANELMDMIIQKVQSNEAIIKAPNKAMPLFDVPKKIKQRALIMQVSHSVISLKCINDKKEM